MAHGRKWGTVLFWLEGIFIFSAIMKWGKDESLGLGEVAVNFPFCRLSHFSMGLWGQPQRQNWNPLPSVQNLSEDTCALFVPAFLKWCSWTASDVCCYLIWCCFTFLHNTHSLWKSKPKNPLLPSTTVCISWPIKRHSDLHYLERQIRQSQCRMNS